MMSLRVISDCELRESHHGGRCGRCCRTAGAILGLTLLHAAAAGSNTLSYYSSRATFDASNPGLVTEDFEEGTAAVGFAAPLDSSSDNAAFSPGDILPGVSFDNTLSGSKEYSFVVVTSSHYAGLVSKVLFNQDDEPAGTALVMDFTDGTAAAGFDFYVGLTDLVTATTHVTIFGESGPIDTQDVLSSDSGPTFFGVSSATDAITRIEILGDVEGAFEWEFLDNVAFLPEPGSAELMLTALGVPAWLAGRRARGPR